MMTAVDGRIDCAMTEQLPGVQEYYSTLDSLAAPSRVSGRVTAQPEMARPGTFEPQDAALGHESFSRNADAGGYEIVIDTRGTLLWDEPDASKRPRLIVTSERVSRDYLAYLGGLHINTAFLAAGQALARSQGRQLVLTYRRRGSRRGLPQRVVRARQRRGI